LERIFDSWRAGNRERDEGAKGVLYLILIATRRTAQPRALGAYEESRMLDKPQIVRTAAQRTAIIRFTIPREEIRLRRLEHRTDDNILKA